MIFDDIVNKILIAAYNEAKVNKHEYMTPEHILFSSLYFKEVYDIMENSGGNVERLKEDLFEFFKENVPINNGKDPTQTTGVDSILNNAATHCISAGKKIVEIGDVLVAFYEEKDLHAKFLMLKNGIDKISLLNYISHGISTTNFDRTVKSSYRSEVGESFERHEKKSSVKSKEDKFLSGYAVELIEKAKKGKIDPFIGRESILKRTFQILARRAKNNPVHVGDPGVGKTAITEGLAKMIADGEAPEFLKDSKIFCIDMGTMVAGTKYRGDFEERIKKVLSEIEKIDNAIVYIDEIHTVIGAGAVSGGSMDASNILKPFLLGGRLRFIGSTTYEEYKKYFEKDRALSRRFQKIEVPEPTVEETVNILKGLKSRYEEYHNVEYTSQALKLASELAAKYINDRHLPDKAIDVMDEAAANVRIFNNTDERIVIGKKDIEDTVASIAKIPKHSVSVDEADKLKTLAYEIKKELYGQDKAVETVVNAIKRARAGFHEGEKPTASLLFVGATGVGKTELARLLAKKQGISILRFDMSEYQEKHSVARLVGAPPGYVGYEEGGLLTDAVRKTPHCVLLLDEIEKAHQDIFNVLLQVMDYATLTDNNGKKADFRNVIIIMTSNAGAREVGRKLIGFEKRVLGKSTINEEVERIFTPEFRNRLDEIVSFNSIDMDMALKIAKREMKTFERKLAEKKIKVDITDRCYKWIAEKGLSSVYGAREILRIIQDNIKGYFVDEVLFGKLKNGGRAFIDVQEDKIKIDKRKGENN